MGRNRGKDNITTFIGPGVMIEGLIDFEGTIRLDGAIKGRIHTHNGKVVIGEQAMVNANIEVDAAIVMGEVRGTISAREKIEVFPPARVFGNLQAPIVSIESGVVFNGKCHVNNDSSQVESRPDSLENSYDVVPEADAQE